MSELSKEIAGEMDRRKDALRKVLAALQDAEEDDPRYETMLTSLAQAGHELLQYEAGVPAKLEAPHRQRSITALTWATRIHMAGGVLLALVPLTGWIGWWWVTLACVQLIVGFFCSVVGEPDGARHRHLRYTAGALSAVTVLVPLCVSGLISSWFWVAVALGWISAFGVAVETGPTTKTSGKVPA